MAMSGRIRSGLPLLNRILRSDSLSAQSSILERAVVCPAVTSLSEVSKNYSTASAAPKEVKVRIPIPMFGGTGNYAKALYSASKKAKALDLVETEVVDFLEAAKRSPTFSLFMKDLTVPASVRIKAVAEICAEAKLSETTTNFLGLLAENGRLRYLDSITKKFLELTMADKGIVKAIVTTVIPLPPQEEKELEETLQEIFGQGKQVKLEQKVDPNILGGLVVQFGMKVFDMSIRTRSKQMERFLSEPANFDAL